MKLENNICIITVCDNHYIILLAALIKSIEINHVTGEKIDIYIIQDNVSSKNQSKLNHSINSDSINLKWLKMSEVIPSNTKLPLDYTSFPVNVYVRLLIPYFVPENVAKVIYLDVDMILNEDISKLWNLDIEDKIVAGVLDRAEKVSNPWGGIKNYLELGLDPGTNYYNSGLMIMRPSKWLELDITNKVFDCIEQNKKYVTFADQYGLNVVLANLWYNLDSKWNCYAISKDVSPYLIHFIGIKPIYNSYNNNPEYKKIFFDYLKLTDWKNFRPVSNNSMLLKKVFNVGKKKVLEIFKN